MWRNSAWTLVLGLVVLMAGVLGCAGDKSNRSDDRDSPYASGVVESVPRGSCH